MISIPFVGNKKYSYKDVKSIVEENQYTTVYEPFGGSCVLSVNLYNDGLVSRVVVNDYDHFFDDYETYLDLKDIVVEEGYKAGLKRTSSDSKRGVYEYNEDGTITKIKSKILKPEKAKILQGIISKNVPERYWKYLVLGNNFCHSGFSLKKTQKLSYFKIFGSYLKTDKQRHYLEVLEECEMNNLDYKDFLNKYGDEIDNNSLLIVDPPYTGTWQLQYKYEFSEKETEELINQLQKLPCDYIFFNRDLEKINEWFKDINCQIKRTGTKSTSSVHNKEEYLIYVHKTS